MELKTCEQYVLDRLIRAEDDVESLKMDIICKDSQIERLKEELETLKAFLREHATKTTTEEGDLLVRFDSLWEQFEPDDYAYMLTVLDKKEGN